MRLNGPLAALASALFVFCLTACVAPEKIVAEYAIRPDGFYVFSYRGTIVNIPARTAQLGLSAMEADDASPSETSFEEKVKRIKLSIQNDPRTNKFQEIGKDTYDITMKESGNIKEQIVSYFYNQELQFSSISFNRKKNTATISIKNIDEESLEILKKLNINIEGNLKILTPCEIISSSAKIEKNFFSDYYNLKIEESVLKEGAEIVIQLD